MTKSILFIAAMLLMASCTMQNEGSIINVADHGIIANSGESITAAINEIIEGLGEGNATIVFPKGRYDFHPDSAYFKHYYETNTYDINPKRLAIFLENKKHITIDGQGSDFVYHEHIQPFTLDHSEDIEIKNLNIDWDYPLTAEGEVVEADSKHITLKIDTKQFPYKVYDKGVTFQAENWEADWKLTDASWLIEFDQNHIIPSHTGDAGVVNGNMDEVKYIDQEPGLLRMEGHFTKTPAIGNYLIMRHSARDHAGMYLFHSKDIKISHVNVHHTSGLGILSQYCENIDMNNVNFIPNPLKGRYLSGHDDALHFMGCKGKIKIDSCTAIGLMDDPINIHGTCVPVVERLDERTLKCRFGQSMSVGLEWAQVGDSVQFLDKKSLVPLYSGVVAGFSLIDKDYLRLEFQEAVPQAIDEGYSIENLSWTPSVSITNSFAGSCRARGYLVSTPRKVLIENCIFQTSGSALLIAGDANYWFESGACTDLTIRNNEFRAPCNSSFYQFCKAIITIFPEIPEPDARKPFHSNIRIENNSFAPFDYPVLFAMSVDGLTFKNNTLTRSYDDTPWREQKQTIHLIACLDVEISGNTISDDLLGKNILVEGMDISELNLGDEAFTVTEKALGEIELMKVDDVAIVPENLNEDE